MCNNYKLSVDRLVTSWKWVTKYSITGCDGTLLGNINGNLFQTLNVFYRVSNWNKEIQPLKQKQFIAGLWMKFWHTQCRITYNSI